MKHLKVVLCLLCIVWLFSCRFVCFGASPAGPQTVINNSGCCLVVRWINTPCGDIYPCGGGCLPTGCQPGDLPCTYVPGCRFQIINYCTGGLIVNSDPGVPPSGGGTNGTTHTIDSGGVDHPADTPPPASDTSIFNPTSQPQTFIGVDGAGNPTGDWATIMPGKTGFLHCFTCQKIVPVGDGNGISGSGGITVEQPWGLSGSGAQIKGYPPVLNPLPGPPEGPGTFPKFQDPFPVNPAGAPTNAIPVDPIPYVPPYTNAPGTTGTNGIIWGSSTNSNYINQQGFGAVYSAVTEDTKDVVSAIQKFNRDNNLSIMNATNMLGQSFSTLVAQGVGISNGVTRIDGSLLVVTNLLGQIYVRQAQVGNGISNTVWQVQAIGSNQYVVMSEIRDTNALELFTMTNILRALTNVAVTSFDFTSSANAGRAMGDSQVADLFTPASQLNSMTPLNPGAPGALMVTIGGISANFNPLAQYGWSNFAAWCRNCFVWLWTFLYIRGAWIVTEEYMRASVGARQTTFNGASVAGTQLNSAIAGFAAVAISTALGSIPAMFVFYFNSDVGSLITHPWAGAGGAVAVGIQYADAFCAAPVAFSNAAFLLAYRISIGRVFWVATTIVRYIVG